MADKIFYSRHDGGLTLFKSGKMSTISSDHPNFAKIIDALRNKRFGEVEELMNVGTTISALGVSRKHKDRKIYVKGGEVFWIDSKGVHRQLEGPLVDRILDNLSNAKTLKFGDALLRFLDNIQKNRVKDIRQELYEWLMSGKTPITYDGCFLAYKKVRSDFKDFFTGTMDNSPGMVVRIPQDQVDKNRDHECSSGLHFCSREYLSHYEGDNCKVLIVKVNPRHVFAIPRDYSFQKGRASEYFVAGVYNGNWKNTNAFKMSFVDEDSKHVAMPEVEFATGWLRPSVKAIAESFGIVNDGQVLLAAKDGALTPVKIVPAVGDNVKVVDILGRNVKCDELVYRSFETKSVRELVKQAVRLADKSNR